MIPGVSLHFLVTAFIGFLIGCFITGVPFGILMAAIFSTMHFSKTDNPNVRHERTLQFNTTIEKVRQFCVEAILSVDAAAVDDWATTESLVTGKVGASIQSWGEVIRCEIERRENDLHVINVRCYPKLAWTMVDYGKNEQNMNAVLNHLEKCGATVVDRE